MAKKLVDAIVMTRLESEKTCVAEFKFEVSKDTAVAENNRVIAYVAGAVQLPGFRSGRAPLAIVKSKFEKEIAEELRNRFLAAAFDKLTANKELDIINVDFKEIPQIKSDDAFSFVYSVILSPKIELGDYKNIKVDVPKEAVTDEEINKRIDMYRSMYGGYTEVDGPAQADDMLKATYKGDFELPEDASATLKRQIAAEDSYLWLSEPETIPGTIKALTGATKGNEYTFTAEYPEDYKETALAGKKVNYTVKVTGIQRRSQLSVEELLKRVGVESEEKFREQISKSFEGEKLAERRNKAGEMIIDKLLETAGNFDVPEALLESEISRELQRVAKETVKSEADADEFKKNIESKKAEVKPAAEKNLRRTLILREIAKLEKINVTDREMEAQMYMMSRQYGCKPKELRDMVVENGAVDELRLDITNAKALNFLIDKAIAD